MSMGPTQELSRRRFLAGSTAVAAAAAAQLTGAVPAGAETAAEPEPVVGDRGAGRPAVVLVHGAFAGAANVTALVYVAAFAPDEGETLGQFIEQYPPEGAHAIVPDAAGFLSIDRPEFRNAFVQDVSERRARRLAAVQRPINSAIFGEPAGPAAWRELPSYYQISEQDRQIQPDLERWAYAVPCRE